MLRTDFTAQAIDDALAGTFPASDPPAWTPGMARPAPEIDRRPTDVGSAADDTHDVRTSDVIDVSRPTRSQRTFAQSLAALIGAVGLALVVPLAILAIGILPALGVRGLLVTAEWLLAIVG